MNSRCWVPSPAPAGGGAHPFLCTVAEWTLQSELHNALRETVRHIEIVDWIVVHAHRIVLGISSRLPQIEESMVARRKLFALIADNHTSHAFSNALAAPMS